MSKFTIYDKSGNVLHESITEYDGNGRVVYTDSLEYNGSWMGECFVTVSVKSPYPINFQIGDYIDYRGERFTLNNDTAVSKKARRGTCGEAFVYENIKFEARQSELSEIRFLDYVLYDNELHYTSLPDFPFYAADIDDYVDRQQANTNRWCESNGFAVADYWLFITPSKARTVQRAATFGMGSATASAIWEDAFAEGTYLDDEKKDISVDISKESIWDSMQRIKQDFGLNFISRGRRVIVGAAGVPTSRIFKYGKGEGLYEIERQIENDQAVVTKLFAYGSDKNMPVRYYGNISYSYYATVGLIYANYASSGLHYADFLIDIDFKSTLFTNRSQSYPGTADNPNYIVEVQVDDITVRGYVTKDYNSDKCRIYCEYTNSDDDRDEPDEEKMDAFSEAIATGDKVYFVAGIDTKKWPADKRENTASDLPNNMAVSRLMLPGFPTTSLYAWILANGGTAVEDARNCDSYGRATWEYDDVEYDAFFSKDQYNPYILSLNFKDIGIREASKVFDGSDDTEKIYPTIEGTGYDVIAGAEVIEDNGVFEDGDTEPTITLTLPDFGIGFDLKKLASDGQNPTIFMKDGYCGSREFSFESGNVKKNQDGTYTIKAKREHDTLLDLWFPYSYGVSCGGQAVADEPYQVRAGDHYVLTGIEMTSTYINAAAVKLLGYSLLFLSKNDYTRYTYLPKVDEIEMARQHERAVASQGSERSLYLTLKEGDVMLFNDIDLGIDGDVFIDSLQIKENGNNGIPTFEVTLRNDKQVGTMQRIENKIDSLSSTVGGGVGISNQGLKNAINAYGSEMFIRKDREDVAQGRIGFLSGLWVKALGLFGIDADGNGKFNNMDAAGDASVGGNLGVKGWISALTGIFNTLKSGNFTQGDLTGTGFQLTNDDGTGASQLVVDNIVARMKFIANVLEVRKYVSMGGNYVFSPAASVIEQVDYLDSNGDLLGYQQVKMPWLLRAIPLLAQTKIFSTKRWIRNVGNVNMNTVAKFRCWIKADDGTTKTVNTWQVGMLARCQTMDLQQSEGGTHTDSNISGANKNRLYWREVVGTGQGRLVLDDGYEHSYIDLSNDDNRKLEGSDIPIVGDSVVCFGATTQNLSNIIVIETVGSDAPAFKEYMGVGLQHIGQDNTGNERPRFSLEDANGNSTLKTRISPKAGDRFVAPEFIIEIDGQQKNLYTILKADINGVEIRVCSLENGKNLFGDGVTKGWVDANGLTTDISYGDRFKVSSENELYSPIVTLEPNTDYCFSAKFDQSPGNDAAYALNVVGTYANGYELYNAVGSVSEIPTWGAFSGGRYYFTFRTGNTAKMFTFNFYPSINCYLYDAQIEKGTTPTEFVANSDGTSSLIKGTSDRILLSVQQGYATKSELQVAADGITSTVESMAGSEKNLLTGSEDFISTNKLEHKSKEKDGYKEYPPSNSGVKIYSAYDLVAGKEYVLQCKSDGTLSDQHYSETGGDPSDNLFTVWLRYFGDDSHNFCFTSVNIEGTKADGSLWWKFTPLVSGTYYFRTNSYSDGSTEVTIHFWDIMCEMGSTASSWVEPKRDTTKSVVTQTASEYDVSIRNGLYETGININGNDRTIHLSAEHTTIDGDLTVPKVTTVKETGFKIEIDGSKFNVYNGQDKVGLSIGWDEYNNPFLFLSNADGSKSVKLTYDGIITDSGNFSSDSFAPVQYKKLEDNHSVTPTQANEGVYDGGNNPSSAGYSDYYVYTAGRNLVTGVYQNSDGHGSDRAECDGKTFSSNIARIVLSDKPYIGEGYYIGLMYSIPDRLNDNIHRKEVISFVSSSPFQGSPSIAGYIYIIKVTPISGPVQYYFCDRNGNNQVAIFDTNHIYNS